MRATDISVHNNKKRKINMSAKYKDEKVVIFLSEGGFKLSSWFGKILHGGMTFSTLDAAKNACEDAGYDYIVA